MGWFKKKPADYQSPLLDRACFAQIELFDTMRNKTSNSIYEISGAPTRDPYGYVFFMDHCTLAMERFRIVGVTALYDAEKRPIPIDGFNFDFETAQENDCAFMIVRPKKTVHYKI